MNAPLTNLGKPAVPRACTGTASAKKFLALIIGLVVVAMCSAPVASAVERTYTLDSHFDEGNLNNVNHDSPNNDQLQLNSLTTPFPFVNVACSQRGTAVRIDVNTCAIIGEYLTAPGGMGRNPSRTTVDKFGNVWVSNRDESGFSGSENKGSVMRIGLVIGGTRCDADGSPNPGGQYLKPPFLYNTCVDRDGDGLIKTSFGLGNVLPWTNAGGVDTHGGVATADDECIINYTRVAGTNTRTVAVDGNNDLWTGGIGDLEHEKVSGVTGLPIAGSKFNVNAGGYGGLIDGNGILWSARFGSGLLRYNTTTLTSDVSLGNGCGDYGLGIDPATGNVWQTNLSGGTVKVISPAGLCLGTYGHGSFYAQGVAVDGSGNVWVAHSLFGATTVGHLRTDGTYVGNVSLPGGNGPTGVAVDANGKVWVANINSNNAMRIDPAAGPIGGGGFPIGAVDCVVDLGAGAGPYNYSDMTGFVAIGTTSPQGTWTVVYDGGTAGEAWGTVSWTSTEPLGSSVEVEVRASDTQVGLSSETFVVVSNATAFSGLNGRFIEVRSTLKRGAGLTDTPILYDLTVKSSNEPPVCRDAVASEPVIWPPNHKYHAISILGVTDPEGDPVTITVTGITQDEPLNTRGDGNTCPDGQIVDGQAAVRAERTGTPGIPGNGRVYAINFTADDGRGGQCTGTVTVCVPHDDADPTCVDDGQRYDSTGPCGGGATLTPEAVSLEVGPINGTEMQFSFALTAETQVEVSVFDVTGRRIATLEKGQLPSGVYQRVWNMAGASRGLYFVNMKAGAVTLTKRVLKAR